MRKLTFTFVPIFLITLLTCLFLLSPNVVMSETVKYEDLVTRKGLYYQKSSDGPFTGKTTGKVQASFKNGKKEGPWVGYHENGQLRYKITYKNGKKEGPWVGFYKNGQLRRKGNFKNGKWDGPFVSYYKNGQVISKGTFKKGKKEGPWVYYGLDGPVNEQRTGTYENGVKVK